MSGHLPHTLVTPSRHPVDITETETETDTEIETETKTERGECERGEENGSARKRI
jgi:hypothetical protein